MRAFNVYWAVAWIMLVLNFVSVLVIGTRDEWPGETVCGACTLVFWFWGVILLLASIGRVLLELHEAAVESRDSLRIAKAILEAFAKRAAPKTPAGPGW